MVGVGKQTTKQASVCVVHGPNLNLLGTREPQVYGCSSLEEIDRCIVAWASTLGLRVESMQSNHEGVIIDCIHSCAHHHDGIIINPAALTHTSIAICDALKAVSIPAVEVHLSNLFAREKFRYQSRTAQACVGVITGFGMESYYLALQYLAMLFKSEQRL